MNTLTGFFLVLPADAPRISVSSLMSKNHWIPRDAPAAPAIASEDITRTLVMRVLQMNPSTAVVCNLDAGGKARVVG